MQLYSKAVSRTVLQINPKGLTVMPLVEPLCCLIIVDSDLLQPLKAQKTNETQHTYQKTPVTASYGDYTHKKNLLYKTLQRTDLLVLPEDDSFIKFVWLYPSRSTDVAQG